MLPVVDTDATLLKVLHIEGKVAIWCLCASSSPFMLQVCTMLALRIHWTQWLRREQTQLLLQSNFVHKKAIVFIHTIYRKKPVFFFDGKKIPLWMTTGIFLWTVEIRSHCGWVLISFLNSSQEYSIVNDY